MKVLVFVSNIALSAPVLPESYATVNSVAAGKPN